MVKFKYEPKEGNKVYLPGIKPGDTLEVDTKDRIEFYRSLDCMTEVKPKTKKSTTKDDTKDEKGSSDTKDSDSKSASSDK